MHCNLPNLFLKLLIHTRFINISLDWSLGNNITEKYLITSVNHVLLIFNEIPFIWTYSILDADKIFMIHLHYLLQQQKELFLRIKGKLSMKLN